MKLKQLKPLTPEYLEEIGFVWHTDEDNTPYVADEVIVISEAEADAYAAAANTLYDMFVEAGEYVIENDLLHEINIPFNLIDAIKESWENDVHWHLYGRFDFAGGVNGAPIKLLEFNADTPTSLFETAIIQWALLKANGLDESSQFNALYEGLVDNFKRLVTLEESVEGFADGYEGWKILFSAIRGSSEDENTTRLLQHIAEEAGFHTEFAFVDEVEFDGEEGVFYQDENYELWFKLIPWEDIAIEEGDLAMILTHIMKNHKAIILNPAYTLMFQSKALMKILWDLFPGHPLLLETSFEPLVEKKQVEKRAFGREGANIRIVEADGTVVEATEGEYEGFKPIYQAYTALPTDQAGNAYQAGVFFAYEGCALGFRRGGKILDDFAKFVGHVVE